ncbi:hypothetical protein IFM89_010180 [Coptis chinensis]|uniref:Uncharacterized protein n=1 Tax=Coptis chinensis TaxID=261450 RepID=A0A835GVQ3_9MAGN|nr:hypothetical protein IFM89_010180 [Coptis chinensis]
MFVIEKDSEIIRGQPQSMEIEQKSAAPNGAMEERAIRDTTSVSIPVGDITSVEPSELVSTVFLDDEAMENFAKLMAVLEKGKQAMPGPLMADLIQKEKEEAKAESARAQMETMVLQEKVVALLCEKEEMVQAIKGKDKECKKAMRELGEEKKTLSELTLKLSLALLEKAQLEAVSKKCIDMISRARDVMIECRLATLYFVVPDLPEERGLRDIASKCL